MANGQLPSPTTHLHYLVICHLLQYAFQTAARLSYINVSEDSGIDCARLQ